MPTSLGRLAGAPKQPVQVRLNDDEIQLVDRFTDELSRQTYGVAFSRAEAVRIAAVTWLRERQGQAPPTAAMPDPQPMSPARREEDAPVTLAQVAGATQSPAIPAQEVTPHTKPLSPKQQEVVQLTLAPVLGAIQSPAIPTEEVTPHTKPLSPKQQAVAEASASPLHQPLKAAWQPIVAFLQQRQNVPAQPAEIVAALGCKAESLAAHLRFMAAAGIVGYRDVGQGKGQRKVYFLPVL